jgi:hypothetical protein
MITAVLISVFALSFFAWLFVLVFAANGYWDV